MSVNCEHWSQCRSGGRGCCALNLYGGKPSEGVCNVLCASRKPIEGWKPDQKSRGLGDTIAKITSAVGIKPCEGCKKRQDALNKIVPYKP